MFVKGACECVSVLTSINYCRDAPQSASFIEDVCNNYQLLLNNQHTVIRPLEVTTTSDMVSNLRSLSDEQLACVFQVEPHSGAEMSPFINALLGADMSPAVVKYTKGFDQTHRVSMDLGGIMTIGVLYELALVNLITPVMGLQLACGLPSPYLNPELYCFFTAAVGWSLGEWANKGGVLGKRKVGQAPISTHLQKLSVLYAHDVCVLDQATPTKGLVKAYASCNLIFDSITSTWITPSPASRLVTNHGVFSSTGSGEVAVQMGQAKAFLEECQSSNAPFDFVAALLSDNSIGKLVSKANTESIETVVVPVGVLKPVLIVR